MRFPVLLMAGLLAGCGHDVPDHTIKETTLIEGQRIQIDVSEDISREECIALILKNREKAEPNGAISVHKYNKALGRLSPWCYDSFDGRGVTFIEYGF